MIKNQNCLNLITSRFAFAEILNLIFVTLVFFNNPALAGDCVDNNPALLCVGRGYAALNDSTDATIVNADSDGDGPGLWAVVVGSKYNGYGSNLTGSDPGTAAQLRVETNGVVMNKNTTVSGTNTLTVGGATTLSSTLGVTGAATLSSTLDARGAISNSTGVVTVADAIKTTNAGGANLIVNETANVASLTSAATGQGLTVTGTTSTILKGGTNSGILTLQDGNAGAGATAGTNITISGSGGGTAATVFQTTTNADTTSVNTSIGTSAVYSAGSTATLQAGPNNAVTVNSGNAGANPGVSINGVVGAGSTSTTGVSIRGDGQNSQPYTAANRAAGTVPNWADVGIYSKSYGLGDVTLGSAIILTDYGVQIVSPQPAAGQQITNNYGSNTGAGNVTNNTGINSGTGSVTNNTGSNTGAGSVLNNTGLNSGSGSVTNNTGGISGSGSSTNNIGMNSSATGGTGATNIGGVSGNGTVANTFGNNTSTTGGSASNSIGMNSGNGAVQNSIGGGSGSGSTTNNIGQNSGTGTVTNNTGGTSGSGNTVNNIGMNSSTSGAVGRNNFGSVSGNGSAINTIGNNTSTTGGSASNSMGMNSGNGSMQNSFGGGSGSGPTTNTIGQNTGTATVSNRIGNANTIAGVATNNTFGVNSGAGAVTNAFGDNTSRGSATNTFGQNAGSGNVVNGIGNSLAGSTGNASNTIGQNNGSGVMTNQIGGGTGTSTNNFGVGTGFATNNIGTGPGRSETTIGSQALGSRVTTQAGNSSSVLANGVSTTAVAAGGGVGGSVLTDEGSTNGNSGIVLRNATAVHTTVNTNGRFAVESGPVAETSASMTVTNGLNNTHGFYVDERRAVMSGGTRSSSLTLHDNGATFSSAATGAPIQVHGVADGTTAFDAVNVRQLYGGVAASMATAPVFNDLRPGETAVGLGTGFYGGYGALGLSVSYLAQSGAQFNLGVAHGLQKGSMTAVRAGVGWKF